MSQVLKFRSGVGRQVSKKTVCVGQYCAEIYVSNPGTESAIFHYIITKIGDAEILFWGQEHSMEDAEDGSISFMRGLGARAAGSNL
jgi:hypothetical protein